MSNPKTILITGASSGVGQATARLLAQQDYRVFGTSRYPSDHGPAAPITMIALDVRSDESVAAGVNTVLEHAGQIDALINNAGYELGGALEETALEEAEGQFATNFFGVVRMVKAVLPTMRLRRQGQIINISSLAGLVSIPFLGMYSASKFALEGYTEALRHEVAPFNIRVSMVEPGFLKTPMMNARQLTASRSGDYEPWRQRALDAIQAFEENGPGPDFVAAAALKIIESKTPRLRYVIGRQATVISGLRRFLPEAMFERGARGNFGLDAKGAG